MLGRVLDKAEDTLLYRVFVLVKCLAELRELACEVELLSVRVGHSGHLRYVPFLRGVEPLHCPRRLIPF
jgi:hypothetical protein